MTSENKRYETTEIKALRGTESKVIARKEQEGWELLAQQQGRVRTVLTFHRPKPKTSWKVWAALGGVGVVLAGIITAGVLLEDDYDSSTAEVTAPAEVEVAPSGNEAEPAPTVDSTICETSPGGDPCKFGQTAIYRDTVRSGIVDLEITVGSPVEFTLSNDAIIPHGLPPRPVNVYFPVTIKSNSDVPPSTVITKVVNAQQGEYDGIREVSDGDVDSFAEGRAQHLQPGESIDIKSGWSMDTLEGVEYRVSISGLSGYTIEFTE